jgi:hypothetical protein
LPFAVCSSQQQQQHKADGILDLASVSMAKKKWFTTMLLLLQFICENFYKEIYNLENG